MPSEEAAFFIAQVTSARTRHTCLSCKGTSQFASRQKTNAVNGTLRDRIVLESNVFFSKLQHTNQSLTSYFMVLATIYDKR